MRDAYYYDIITTYIMSRLIFLSTSHIDLITLITYLVDDVMNHYVIDRRSRYFQKNKI